MTCKILIPILLFCILATIHQAYGFYTILNNDEQVCFQEDMNPRSFAHISYDAHNLGVMESLIYTVRDSSNKVIDERVLSERKNMLYFTSPSDQGETYDICFKPRSILHAPLRLSVKIDSDRHQRSKNPDKTQLERINEELEILKNRLSAVREDHTYFRNREARFRNTTNSTASRVFWFAVFEVAIVLFLGYVQTMNLGTYLKTKKIQ